MLESIKKEENRNKCFFALNTSLVEFLNDIEYKAEIEKVYTFHQKELKIFSKSSIEILGKWYNEFYSEKEINDYKKLMLDKFKAINFDIIIAFSPVPYFKEIFPNASIFYYEFGMFSRPPYPVTFFLDPVGPGGYSYIKKFNSQIFKNLEISAYEEKLFQTFLDEAKKIVLKDNPFSKKIEKLRHKYKKIILLPLQFNNFYLYDLEIDYKSQFEYLEDVLIKTSKLDDVGILVTQHPGAKVLSTENIKYFEENYSNFIFLKDSLNYSSVSQLIIPFVDAIITVSSSIGYHVLLWEKKLIALGKNYFKIFSDSNNLDEVEKIFEVPYKKEKRKKLLYWIITNYLIPEDYIKNGEWLNKYFKRGLENINNLENFYQSIDTPENIFKHLIKKFSKNSLDSLVSNYLEVFINTGDGYTSEKSYKLNLEEEKRIKLNDCENIVSVILRIHGLSLVKFNEIKIKNEKDEIISIIGKESSYYEIYPNVFYIDSENYMSFNINSKVKEIIFDVENYKNIDTEEILEMYKKIKKEIEVKELEKNNLLNKKNEEIQYYKDSIENIKNSINQVLSSKSNKIIHFCNRIFYQLFLGSFKEKKKFLNWLLKKQEELSDDRYNPTANLLNKINNK